MAKKAQTKKTTTVTTVTTTTTTVDTNVNSYILVDRSGSMVDLWKEAIGSINGYVDELKKNKTKGAVTVAFFDDQSFDIGRSCPFSRFQPLTEGEYSPRGMTPLYDSFVKLAAMAEEDDNEKTVIVVMTDGHENASKEMSQATVKAKVKSLSKRGWEVIFLGANFDATSTAASAGLASNKFVNSSKMKLSNTMRDLGSRTRAYAGATDTAYTAGASMNYTEEDKANAL